MKKMPLSILCGIASVILTLILYFTIIGNIFIKMICFATLLGVIVAEIVVTVMAYYTDKQPGKVVATAIVSLMIPISILLSLVYIIKYPYGYGIYLGYYFSAFSILLVIGTIIWRFSDGIQEKNDAFQHSKQNMLNLRKLVKVIMNDPVAEKYKKELSNIEEKLHFSNDAVITKADSEIYNLLTELKENIGNEEFDVDSHIQEIVQKVDIRDIYSKKTV